MELQVVSGKHEPLPFLNIVHLTEGDVVKYTPLDRGREKRSGDVSLVLVPTRISGKEELIITDPREAAKPQQWEIPQTIALAVFVYGPQGLSKKKVKNFLSQDESLVAQLAEYADKTAQTQALISALVERFQFVRERQRCAERIRFAIRCLRPTRQEPRLRRRKLRRFSPP